MTLYILAMVVIEDKQINEFDRGVFTSIDKAKEGANTLIQKCLEEAEYEVPEIYISKIESDVVTEPVGVMGWLKNDNGEYFLYFDMTQTKTLADKIKDGDELSDIERKLLGVS